MVEAASAREMQDGGGGAGAFPGLRGEAAAGGVEDGSEAGGGGGDRRLHPGEALTGLGLAGGHQALAGRTVEAAGAAAAEGGGEPAVGDGGGRRDEGGLGFRALDDAAFARPAASQDEEGGETDRR